MNKSGSPRNYGVTLRDDLRRLVDDTAARSMVPESRIIILCVVNSIAHVRRTLLEAVSTPRR
jgi:hypothetical protein